jgi:PAS domain S-box-containing protein
MDAQLLDETANELFEDAPCGYLTTRLDGTIVKVNRTFERWTGLSRDELLNQRRFQDLLSPGGRIYHDTHYAPLLRMQGAVKEIAVEVMRADRTRLPALVNSVLHYDQTGQPQAIRTTVFDATDRRRYEQELIRAREREREGALWLQRSFLGGDLPAAAAFELEVFYSPSGQGIEAGGDWYDAFWLEDGEAIGLIVGDVVGRGLAAATTMGQLRSAVRAFATVGLRPAELLAALDGYSERFGVGAVTTVTYAEVDPAAGSMRFASAGHPPPLVCGPNTTPRLLWEGRSPAINILGPPPSRGDTEITLEPGATVLLYTDGLVEHRHRSVDDGMAELLHLVAGRREQPLDALIESITGALFDPATSDDRCVLGLRLPAAGG